MYKPISRFATSLGLCTLFTCGALSPATTPALAQEEAPQTEETTPKLPVISAAEAARLTGAPTLVTLHFDNGKVKDVFAEIRKQLGLPAGSNDFQVDRDETPVTLHIERQPFWTAMRAVAAKTHRAMGEERLSRSNTVLQFMPGDRGLESPAVTVEPFMFTFSQAKRTRQSVVTLSDLPAAEAPDVAPKSTDQLSLLLNIFVDPKLQIVPSTTQITWQQIIDEKGNSLLDTGQRSGTLRTDNRYMLQEYIRFNPKTDPGRRLTSIKGELHAFIVTKYDTWEVANPLQVKDLEKVGAAGEASEKYIINDVTASGNSYRVRVRVLRPHLGFGFSQITDALTSGLTLYDEAGTALINQGGSRRGLRGVSDARSAKFYEFEANEALRPARSTTTATTPVKLVWKIPLEFREVVVPFEFKDLPLP